MNDVLVAGICAVDMVASPIERLPAPGQSLTFGDSTLRIGGCAANVATALARLGTGCDFITRVGADALGSFLIDELEAAGIGCGGVTIDPEACTPFTFVMIDAARHHSFFHCPGSNANLRPSDFTETQLDGKRFLVIAGAMGMASLDGDGLAEILMEAQRRSVTTVVDTLLVETDPKTWLEKMGPVLQHCDYFMPSRAEAERITGESELRAIAARLTKLGAQHLVIKLGAEGAYVKPQGGFAMTVPAFPVASVVDAAGAGDCFVAGTVTGLLRGLALTDAVRLGNAVAALSLRRSGATDGVPTLERVLHFMGRG